MDKASSLGHPAVAITDHGGLHGFVKFYQKCRDMGIKPIIGSEVYVAPDRTAKTKEVRNLYFHLVLLARTNQGLENLISIVSDAGTQGFYQKPRTDISFLADHGTGIIALSACPSGELAWLLMGNQWDDAMDLARTYSDIFDAFYLELEASDTARQVEINRRLCSLARAGGFPLVATNDAHYIDKLDAFYHDVLLAIQTGRSLADPTRLRLDGTCYWFKDEESTRQYLSLGIDSRYIDEAISNTCMIANACNVELELGHVKFPSVKVPAGYTPEEYLRHLAMEGLSDFVSKFNVDEEIYRSRLEYELQVVIEAGLTSYFLMVEDIYRYVRERNIPHGPARGSAGGCLLARCLGVTQIDPVRHNLPFERFWVPGRVGMPDIDCDFAPERRAELYRYIIDTYGIERCAHIGTFGTLNPRVLIRDIARVLSIPLVEADRIAKLVPEVVTDSSGERLDISIDTAMAQSEELAHCEQYYPELFDIARKLEGLPRHASVHAAGVLIAPEPILSKVPVTRSKAEDDPLPVTQIDMGDVEQLGYLKMDLLGVDALSVIADCLDSIEQRTGKKIDLLTVPLDDPKVYENIRELHTLGVFQINTPVGKQICSQVQPSNFDELTDVLALARPGPMNSGQDKEYVIHKLGVKPVEYIHPLMEPILSPTYGVMLYQEQLMAISRELAGFDHAGADKVRKGIAKKLPEVLHELREKFVQGCLAKQTLSEEEANFLWDQMEHYGGYVFNRAHACAYAYISYWTAWLKTYYPIEFMAASLTNESRGSGKDRDQKVIDALLECRRMGIRVLPPNINESGLKFTVESAGCIRFPLTAIKGIGDRVTESVIMHSPYVDLADFLARVPKRQCNRRALSCLILAGAFDCLDPDRVALINTLYEERPIEVKIDSDTTIRVPKTYTMREHLEWEKILLGTYISGHPLDQLGLDSWRGKPVGERVTVVGNIYSHRTLKIKKGRSAGQDMCLCNIDTTEGQLTIVIFPEQLQECRGKIRKNNTVKVTGTLGVRDGVVQVVAKDVVSVKVDAMMKSGVE